METKLEVEGLKELRRSLKAFDAGLVKKLQAVGKRVADRIVDRSKPDIPVDTGLLKSTARGTSDSAVLGNARVTYTEYVYWDRRHRWYHRAADVMESNGQLERLYTEGLEDMLRAAGLDYTS